MSVLVAKWLNVSDYFLRELDSNPGGIRSRTAAGIAMEMFEQHQGTHILQRYNVVQLDEIIQYSVVKISMNTAEKYSDVYGGREGQRGGRVDGGMSARVICWGYRGSCVNLIAGIVARISLAANSSDWATESLDGFAFALAADGRFLYISETVSIYLGLSQVLSRGMFFFRRHQRGAAPKVLSKPALMAGGTRILGGGMVTVIPSSRSAMPSQSHVPSASRHQRLQFPLTQLMDCVCYLRPLNACGGGGGGAGGAGRFGSAEWRAVLAAAAGNASHVRLRAQSPNVVPTINSEPEQHGCRPGISSRTFGNLGKVTSSRFYSCKFFSQQHYKPLCFCHL
ncbi:Neuronal PAS domain-containing protein 3 [Homalodisca vitripennis]|nr:Neuronal PAS domain-containing protein 3 [Homalodisca vitripennis]